MRELLLLRHAKSGWDDPGLRDHDRPLNARGEASAPQMGELLAAEGLVPDRVLSSTAVRARRTAELVAETCGAPDASLLEELYLAPPAVILEAVARSGKDAARILVVAHNPGLEELVSHLSAELQPFPTAALAHFRVEIEAWSEIELGTPATLMDLWRPKELR